MKRFMLRSLACVLAVVLTVSRLWSCPFCLAPPQTFSEQFVLSDFVVVAALLRVDGVGGGQPARSVLRVRAVLAGKAEDLAACGLKPGVQIVYPGEAVGRSGDLFCCTATVACRLSHRYCRRSAGYRLTRGVFPGLSRERRQSQRQRRRP